jgi:hypothetical protein
MSGAASANSRGGTDEICYYADNGTGERRRSRHGVYRRPLRVQTINAEIRPRKVSRIISRRIIKYPPFRFQRRPGLFPGLSCLKPQCFAQEPASPPSEESYFMSGVASANSRGGTDEICYYADNGTGVRCRSRHGVYRRPLRVQTINAEIRPTNTSRIISRRIIKYPRFRFQRRPGLVPGLSCLKPQCFAQEPASPPSEESYFMSGAASANSRPITPPRR